MSESRPVIRIHAHRSAALSTKASVERVIELCRGKNLHVMLSSEGYERRSALYWHLMEKFKEGDIPISNGGFGDLLEFYTGTVLEVVVANTPNFLGKSYNRVVMDRVSLNCSKKSMLERKELFEYILYSVGTLRTFSMDINLVCEPWDTRESIEAVLRTRPDFAPFFERGWADVQVTGS